MSRQGWALGQQVPGGLRVRLALMAQLVVRATGVEQVILDKPMPRNKLHQFAEFQPGTFKQQFCKVTLRPR